MSKYIMLQKRSFGRSIEPDIRKMIERILLTVSDKKCILYKELCFLLLLKKNIKSSLALKEQCHKIPVETAETAER
jgi:hypothetical protein